MAREHVLCMDILNYSSSFFDIPRNEPRTVDFESDLESARGKIQAFVNASRASGYKIIGFIDKSISTYRGNLEEMVLPARGGTVLRTKKLCGQHESHPGQHLPKSGSRSSLLDH